MSTEAMPPRDLSDPVIARRVRVEKLVGVGKRLGYGLFLLAMILFFVGFATSFSDGLVSIIVACLLIGSLVLAPAIIFGYAVKAADREDMGLPSGH